ncbi:MAG: ATP-binding protein [Planctomycetes bacterium]|nr:ATP-binding protein [Planctomycetota bacterium]
MRSPEENASKGAAPETAWGTTVLVVDDVPVDRRKAGGLIEHGLGWKVIYADQGRAALALMEHQLPHLVLTDLQMPEMDGLELVEAVRLQHPLVPVVLMTAHGSEDIALQALQKGAASYVPKKNLARALTSTLEQVRKASVAVLHHQRLLACTTFQDTGYLLDNDPSLINAFLEVIKEVLNAMRLYDETDRIRVTVALEEALLNALYHGNLGVSSQLRQKDDRLFYQLVEERRRLAPYRDRRIEVQTSLSRSGATFLVRDEGSGFDPNSLPDPTDPANLEQPGGRGLLLIRTFMDEVSHNATGNQITMTKRRPPPGA